MVDVIYGFDGKPVSTSKNLAGVRRYAKKHRAAVIAIRNDPDDETGWMNILFENGSHFRVQFGEYLLLCQWVSRWRAVHGVKLYVNGYDRGTVQYRKKFDIS